MGDQGNSEGRLLKGSIRRCWSTRVRESGWRTGGGHRRVEHKVLGQSVAAVLVVVVVAVAVRIRMRLRLRRRGRGEPFLQ